MSDSTIPWTVYARIPCPLLSPGDKLMSIELGILSIHFILCCTLYFCLQSFPTSESFPMSWLFLSGHFGASASASVLAMNIQGWFPLVLISLIILQSKGFSKIFSSAIIQKHQLFSAQPSLLSSSHIHT